MPATHQTRTASALLHFGFALTGVVTTLLGPLLPWLSARWSLTDAQAGYFFTAQFVGSMVGVALSGITVRRLGFGSALMAGYLTLALGVAMLGMGIWPFALLPVFIYGIGLGVAIPTTNLYVSDANPESRAAALNLLNLSWGVGAIVSPTLLSLVDRVSPTRIVGPALAVVLAEVAVALSFVTCSASVNKSRELLPSKGWRNLGISTLFCLGAVFYLYVGTENALAGWIASYARRVGTQPTSLWLLAPSFFWGALLVGRAIAPAVLRRTAEQYVAAGGLLIAATGSLILIAAPGFATVFLAAVLAGVGLASVYPIAIAQLSHRFGNSATRVAPIMFALAGFGGATIPWTVGFVSTSSGSLRSGLAVPLGGTLCMLGVFVLLAVFGGAAAPSKASAELRSDAATL